MRIVLLCNAGLAMEYNNEILLVDALNADNPPFAEISEELWMKILNRIPPFDRVSALYFTHLHPDHCDLFKLKQYQDKWPEIPCWVPDGVSERGEVRFGSYTVEYAVVDHAPMEGLLPKHVVTWITAGEKHIYIAADAALEPEAHQRFVNERKADAAFWNSMYLSRAETRLLLRCISAKNYIYHMPENDPDGFGIWKKCKNNLNRYPDELRTVRVLKRYPSVIEI